LLPFYTAIVQKRPGDLPGELKAVEHSPEIAQLRERFQSELLSSPRRPPDDKSLFTSLLSGPSGIFTLRLPDSTPCLLSFSTPLRAGTYASVHSGPTQLQYVLSTPREFAQMLADLKRNGAIQRFAGSSSFTGGGTVSAKTARCFCSCSSHSATRRW